jgi:hypothetical protein
MPGVVYGNTIYASVVIGEFTDELIEKLRELAESDARTKYPSAAQAVINVIDYGLTQSNVKDFNYALAILRKAKPNEVPKGLASTLNYVMTNIVWDKTMAKARELANQGLTVVFDNNDAAASNKVDIAFVSDTTDLIDTYQDAGKENYKKAVSAINSTKVIPTPSGKGIVDILQGKATSGVQISKAVSKAMLDLKNSIYIANKVELNSINTELKSLRSLGVLDAILKEQNITADQVREALAKRKEILKDVLDINDISVGDVVMFTKQLGSQERFPGMIIKKDNSNISIAPISLNDQGGTNESLNDLFNSPEVSTFTARQIYDFIFPMAKEATPVTPDPDVKTQSDAAQEEVKSTPSELAQRLKDNIEYTNNQSVEDTVNDFIDVLFNGKNVKKQ